MAEKTTSFSKAHTARTLHPDGVSGEDARYFGEHCPSSTDAARRERHGDGSCRGNNDERFFSNFLPDSTHRTNADGPVIKDAAGLPAFSENLSSAAMETADRIRRRER